MSSAMQQVPANRAAVMKSVAPVKEASAEKGFPRLLDTARDKARPSASPDRAARAEKGEKAEKAEKSPENRSAKEVKRPEDAIGIEEESAMVDGAEETESTVMSDRDSRQDESADPDGTDEAALVAAQSLRQPVPSADHADASNGVADASDSQADPVAMKWPAGPLHPAAAPVEDEQTAGNPAVHGKTSQSSAAVVNEAAGPSVAGAESAPTDTAGDGSSERQGERRAAPDARSDRSSQAAAPLDAEAPDPPSASTGSSPSSAIPQPVGSEGNAQLIDGAAPSSPAAKSAPAPAAPAPQAPPEARFAETNHPKIISSVQGTLLPRGGTMQIRLDPPELGALNVIVKMHNGVMTAQFQTSNEDATRLLSHSLNLLKHSLESQGVTVDKLQVQQSREPRDASADQQQRQNGEQQPQNQEQQRREMLRRMWRRLANGSDPLDMVA